MSERMMQRERHPATMILGPTGAGYLIWSDGQSEAINEARAEDLRGQVPMTISTVSDMGADATRQICQGAITERM